MAKKTAAQRWSEREDRLAVLCHRAFSIKESIDPDSPGGRARRTILRRRFSALFDAAVEAGQKAVNAKKRAARKQKTL